VILSVFRKHQDSTENFILNDAWNNYLLPPTGGKKSGVFSEIFAKSEFLQDRLEYALIIN